MTPVVETVLQFGPKQSLVGILAAAPVRVEAAPPAVIILNTGIAHRTGHHRIFVGLARALAAEGRAVLRFDLSGLGDSLSRDEELSPMEANAADIRAAVDRLADLGHREVVLLGLCSGADRAVAYAGEDARVAGVALIDPSVPPTARFRRLALRRRITRHLTRRTLPALPREAIRLAKGVLDRGRSVQDAGTAAAAAAGWLKQQAVRDYLENAYRSTVTARIPMLAIMTDNVQMRHNYREQLLDAFPTIPFGDLLQLEFWKGADHLFSREDDRARLLASLQDWLGGLNAQGKTRSAD